MDSKDIVLKTLQTLHQDKVSNQMALAAIRKKKKLLEEAEVIIKTRLEEIRMRIDYNLAKHKDIL